MNFPEHGYTLLYSNLMTKKQIKTNKWKNHSMSPCVYAGGLNPSEL